MFINFRKGLSFVCAKLVLATGLPLQTIDFSKTQLDLLVKHGFDKESSFLNIIGCQILDSSSKLPYELSTKVNRKLIELKYQLYGSHSMVTLLLCSRRRKALLANCYPNASKL